MIGLFVLALIITGIFSMQKLPVDAVPDITNNQVQIVTTSSSLAPQEVEQFITFPVEMSMANIPGAEEIRSISRFGLSVVTVVFEEDIPIMKARQFVKEQIDIAQQQIPASLGTCEMMPITTGLGEIYQYTLQVDSAYRNKYSPMELRTIQDWIVKRQLNGTEGIIEVSSFGGYLKQYEVSIDPLKLQSHGVTISEVFKALEENNQNSGGSYIEKDKNAYYIRTEGLVTSMEEIREIVIKTINNTPVFIRDVADVQFGHPPRFGAMTMDGKGEAVGGITLMLKGANSSEAIENVHTRVAEVQKSLPPGVRIEPYLDRSVLVGKAIHTVSKNLIEGGLIVIFVLILLLGNFRAGLIVASVIPLSLLFAFILMNVFGVSANLMSLGAIDFGIVVDGAVIVVEGVLHLMYTSYVGRKLTQREMDDSIISTSSNIIGSAAFGVLIIIVVFIPIMTLTGIEGKMFTPMAKTVSFAIIGALILSITYVPAMSALVLNKNIKEHQTFADKIVNWLRGIYKPTLTRVLEIPYLIVGVSLALLISVFFIFRSMGGEFIPTLEEGDLAMQVTIPPGSSLTQMIATTTEAEQILMKNFPEVKHVISKIGTAEVPTDPMAVEDGDVMILLKDKSEWQSASNREELAEKMKEALSKVKNAQFDFTQPIQLRFNELISGSKTDVVIKLYGEDLSELSTQGKEIAALVKDIKGAGDVKIEQTEGLPQLMVRYNRKKLALHGVSINELNKIVRSAFAGENSGTVYEGERRFDLTVRLDKVYRKDIQLSRLFVTTSQGNLLPLSELATVKLEEGPMQVSRENAKRRIAVGVNIRNRDIASYINEVQKVLDKKLKLKPGYFIEYGGQFENLTAAKKRLAVAVPIALVLIFILLFFAFSSMRYALLIYSTVPLAAVGGVFALLLRGMPFSISAGVGFIALFGVAVLNGIVLISYFNRLKEEGISDIKELVIKGALVRLRPVLMTAAVASLGFLPMAISSSAGAEVQKPLATVVIGGLITATLLTLLVLPVIYYLSEKKRFNTNKNAVALVALLFIAPTLNAQELTESMAIDSMIANSYRIQNGEIAIQQKELDRKSAVSLGNTSFGYQYGQINSELKDYYWQLDQNLGNPLYMAKKSNEAKAGIHLQEVELARLRDELTWKVRSAWNDWILTSKLIRLLEGQMEQTDKYLNQIEEKKAIGEISSLDVSMAEIYRSELVSTISQLKVEHQVAENSLRALTLIQGDMNVPEDTEVKCITTQLSGNDSIQSSILAVENAKVLLSEKAVSSERSRIFPDISIGYFNQQLDHVRGFQGLKFGINIPVMNRSYYTGVRRTKLQAELQANQLADVKQQVEIRVQNLRSTLQLYSDIISEYEQQWNEQIKSITMAVETELNSGEIDYFKYVQANAKALDLNMRLLRMINEYNQVYFELEYLTNK